MASIRKKRTGGGERRFEVRWRDGLGADRSKTFTTERDARRFKVDVERRAQLGGLYDAGPVSFAEFVDGWLERYEGQVRPSTYQRAVQALRTVRELGAFRVNEIRAGEIEDRIARLARRAPRQAAIALQLLKRFLRCAQERGHMVDSAVFSIPSPRYEERETSFLTLSEVEELARHCAEGRMVLFAALTGLRQGEVFALRRSDVDLPARLVRVERGSRAGSATRTKTGRKRVRRSSMGYALLRAVLGAREGRGRLPNRCSALRRSCGLTARCHSPAPPRSSRSGRSGRSRLRQHAPPGPRTCRRGRAPRSRARVPAPDLRGSPDPRV